MVLAAKYRVTRTLGEGGMGVVLAAEHVVSGKPVAIKWLHPKMANEPDAGQRFVREARAAARVRHPNVVDVYDVVQQDGTVFLVMELLEGEPLSAVIARGELTIPALVALLVEAMRGVAAAHKQGVVHRDIKPENIFLAHMPDRAAPMPKLLDFGISKIIEGDHMQLTLTGEALGTPMYMSYEQLQGARDLDGRADVYSFAVILYEALTGRPPYLAETFSQLLLKIATEAPLPPKKLRADVPTELDAVVQRAMAKDRDKRTPSINALIAQLMPFASEGAFRAMMTAHQAPTPAIRARSKPDRTEPFTSSQSGMRRAGSDPAADKKPLSTSDAMLQRLRPHGALMVLLTVVALALAFGGYWLLRPGTQRAASTPAAPAAEAAAPPSRTQPESATTVSATRTVHETPQILPATVLPQEQPPAALSSEPPAAASPAEPAPKPERMPPRKPKRTRPEVTAVAASKDTSAPLQTPAASEPPPAVPPVQKQGPRLRAGQPLRQDF